MKNADLIINTRSRRGRRALNYVIKLCQHNKITLDNIYKVRSIKESRAALKKIKFSSPDVLIVGGGDGTVSSVVNYLAGTSITLGVIPLGTTNNFARSLGLSLGIKESVETIKLGKSKLVDLGKISDDYFSNVAGIGLSAVLAREITHSHKRRFGRLAYAVAGLQVLLRHKPFLATLTDKDGELKLYFETHQIIVANGKFHAGKEIADDAGLDSRELVVLRLGGKSKLSFLWHMLDFYFGKRRSVKRSSYLIGKDIHIKTSTPQSIELDGEVKHKTPVPLRVNAKAIKVFHT